MNTKKKPTQVEERWADMYLKQGMSMPEIAERCGESRQRINYALKKMGVRMRSRAHYFVEPVRKV